VNLKITQRRTFVSDCQTVTCCVYRRADKSLARPTFRCILFDGENTCISFDASLVIYINSTNTPPIMIINRIHEHQNLLSLYLVPFLVGLRTYQHLCILAKCSLQILMLLSEISTRKTFIDPLLYITDLWVDENEASLF